jgi:hypothetical protein
MNKGKIVDFESVLYKIYEVEQRRGGVPYMEVLLPS